MITEIRNGVGWSSFSKISSQAGQLLVTIVMSRFLLPVNYGQVAMVTIFIGFANILVELGLGSSVVYVKSVNQRQISSVFWLNILLGLFFGTILYLSSGLISRFYGIAELIIVTKSLSIIFVIGAIGIVPRNLLMKDLVFKKIAIVEIISTLISGAVGIFLAVSGYGVWALIVYQICIKLIQSLLFLLGCNWWPTFILTISEIKDFIAFGKGLVGFNLVNYWSRQGDSLMIGKVLGAGPLGLYNRAYSVMLLPITQINSVIGQVLFPALTKINEDSKRIKSIYLNVQEISSFISFPLMFGLLAISRPFIITVFGNNWLEMLSVFRILCLVSIIQLPGNLTGVLFSSTGRTGEQFKLSLINSVIVLTFILVGVVLGSIEFVALFYMIANFIITPLLIQRAGKKVEIKIQDVISSIKLNLVLSLIMCGIMYISVELLDGVLNQFILLITSTLVGIFIYSGLSFLFKAKSLSLILDILKKK